MIKAYVRYKGTWAHLNRPRSMRESLKERSDRNQMNCLYVPKNREEQTDGVGDVRNALARRRHDPSYVQ